MYRFVAKSKINKDFLKVANKLNEKLGYSKGRIVFKNLHNTYLDASSYSRLIKSIYERGYRDALNLLNIKVLENE